MICYLQYICPSQDRQNRDYSRLSFDYIAYSAKNMGKRCVFVIYIHEGNCTTFIFILLWFGLSHWYNIQEITGWPFVIVLQSVKRFVWDHSVLTQYSYYRDFYCSWPASRLHDRGIVGYIPQLYQQVSTILWNITITVWLKWQVHHVTHYFVLMHQTFTPQNTETHYTVIVLSY